MKENRYIRNLFFLVGALFFLAQLPVKPQEVEVKSKKVGFVINNLPDTKPPQLKLITPAIGQQTSYTTENKEFDLIGEVKDESAIKFVSVNSEMRDVNQYGLFSTRLELIAGENQVRMVAMDINDNFSELILTIEYIPPILTLEDKINRNSQYYALLIGIDDYRDEGIQDLENPINDAEKFYNVLTSDYTFNPDHVKILRNPTRSDIISELDLLRSKVTSEDNLLIFYAGHGYWDEQGRIGYWLPSDAKRTSTVDWFRNSTLVDYLQVIKSKHTLLITDACFAGSIFKARSITMDIDVAYEKIYDMPSRKAMTSGTLTEVPDESAFIKYLIQRLDENQEKYLSSEELYSRIKMAVISNSKVVPQYGEIQNVGNEGGDFIFLRRNK